MKFKSSLVALSLGFLALLSPLTAVRAAGVDERAVATECSTSFEDLTSLFSNQDDDFPSQVNRVALFDYLTVENQILFSKLHYSAVEAVLATHGVTAKYIAKNFKKLTPKEIYGFASATWQKMVELSSGFGEPDEKNAPADLSRVKVELESRPEVLSDFKAQIKMYKKIMSIEAEPEIKKETIALMVESFKNSVKQTHNFEIGRDAINQAIVSRGGYYHPGKTAAEAGAWGANGEGSLGSKIGWANNITFAGTLVAAGIYGNVFGDIRSWQHFAEVAAAAPFVTPVTYGTIQLARTGYNKALASIRRRLDTTKIKKEIKTEGPNATQN